MAIDPGSSSGAYCLGNVMAGPISVGRLESLDHLARLALAYRHATWIVENVGWGRPGESISAANSFSRHRGHIDGVLRALDIRPVLYSPSKWIPDFLGPDRPKVSKLQRITPKAAKKARKDAIHKKVQAAVDFPVYKYQADAVALLLHHLQQMKNHA